MKQFNQVFYILLAHLACRRHGKTDVHFVELAQVPDVNSKNGLDSTFGRFLRDVASPSGAEAKLLLDSTVRVNIDQHDLWRVFRVRLS